MTIQSTLQEALTRLSRSPVHVVGSGRTDAGVHASAQVAHFDSDQSISIRSLNGILPRDIRIQELQLASPKFHARFSALSKTYRYHISTGEDHDPFTRLYSHHVFYHLHPDLLSEAAGKFIGTFDFTSFANSASMGAAAKNAVRTITNCAIHPTAYGYMIEISANGFLYKMVRNIVGLLIRCGNKQQPLRAIDELLKAKDRTQAPAAAPS